jgi:uncharacterized protein
MIKITSKEQIEDLTRGCCFFGAGGGGDPQFGQKMLQEALEAGKNIRIVDIDTFSDDAWIVTPYLMGSIGPETAEVRKAKEKCGLTKETVVNMPTAATHLLLQKKKVKLDAVIPLEIGGASTASSVATAAWLDVPVIDGDYVGRAVPEISQVLPAINQMDLLPIASSDAYGNQTIIENATSLEMAERLGKMISIASFGLIGQATLLIQVRRMKSFMLPHTISKALAIGSAIRRSREEKSDFVQPVIELTGGKILFIGAIKEHHGEEADGYYIGSMVIEGTDQFKQDQLKIWFKNENIIAWLNEKPCLTCPDLIAVVQKSTGEPILNSQLTKGTKVIVFGVPSSECLRSKNALRVLGPEHFGFEFEAKLL